MSQQTKIEWCDATFNPWIGCTAISPACDNCYAEAQMDKRLHQVKWGAGNPRKRTSVENWKQPIRWNKQAAQGLFVECMACGQREFRKWDNSIPPGGLSCCSNQHCLSLPESHSSTSRPRVFCASLADWLDNEIAIEWFVDLLDVIRQTPSLDWLLLTKRVGNFHDRIAQAIRHVNVHQKGKALFDWLKKWDSCPPDNVWIGITVVNQLEAERDIPKLLSTPARTRFLSIEPMLGEIDLTKIGRTQSPGYFGDCLQWYHRPYGERDTPWNGINWVICGGESGSNARPMNPEWVRKLRNQCQKASVPFLFKQWGEWAPFDRGINDPNDLIERNSIDFPLKRFGKSFSGRLLDGDQLNHFPEQSS